METAAVKETPSNKELNLKTIATAFVVISLSVYAGVKMASKM